MMCPARSSRNVRTPPQSAKDAYHASASRTSRARSADRRCPGRRALPAASSSPTVCAEMKLIPIPAIDRLLMVSLLLTSIETRKGTCRSRTTCSMDARVPRASSRIRKLLVAELLERHSLAPGKGMIRRGDDEPADAFAKGSAIVSSSRGGRPHDDQAISVRRHLFDDLFPVADAEFDGDLRVGGRECGTAGRCAKVFGPYSPHRASEPPRFKPRMAARASVASRISSMV